MSNKLRPKLNKSRLKLYTGSTSKKNSKSCPAKNVSICRAALILGVVGVAGNLDVGIIPIKVLDAEGQGDSDIVAKGIEYAVDQGAQIINLSLGGPGEDVDIANAVRYANEKGVLVFYHPLS